ncbi:MAG: TIGR03619 family F420-dependent LLM class oxidoreductase [Novosphingobium sp.]|nr:TIGR03619 family F420-dependent LLM class oxidoreductase [Novosphingobium sp.]
MAIKVGVNILGLQSLVGGTVKDVLDVVVEADRKGVDYVTLGDHLGFQRSAHETRRQTHAFPFVLEEPWPEPITFLSAAAALTERIRLSTFVLIAPLRPTLLLAKQLATLDNISNGRVTMGLGVGWQEEEFAAAGMTFEGRFGDLEDMVTAMRALWSEPPAKASGRHFHFEDFYSLPRPVQGADLPLLFGIKPTQRNIDRMARLANGWALNPADRKEFVDTVKEVKRLAAAYGRDPDALEFDVGQGPSITQDGALDEETIRRRVRQDEADGATIVSFLARDFCKRPEDIGPFLDFIVSLKE